MTLLIKSCFVLSFNYFTIANGILTFSLGRGTEQMNCWLTEDRAQGEEELNN
jgi:hypothetical protein